ncbi:MULTISPECIES: hypothetical protein [Amycolatopsis]|uniref:Uncharacterized protein n=1 Tax=Amycolatopsis bullii TaxID=941987 RepID=A0ABQ3KQ81_9PSEU|nr:hypothetical protein [Amycolatopsis bullii]GHG42747.1 hypothetical protein GCM10017567_75820 [Amycolatopsis bullii]
MLSKIDRVLDGSGIHLLATALDDDFGIIDTNLLVAAGQSTWLDTITLEKDKQDLLQSWEALRNASPDDPELRRACVDLTRRIRRFLRLEHRKLWRAAVTEQRLVHLVECIDKSLRPRLIERIRQQFGK